MFQDKNITLLPSLGFGFILLLLAGVGFYSMSSLSVIDDKLSSITEDLQKRYSLTVKMRAAARERTLHLQNMILLEDAFERDNEWVQYNAYGASFTHAREELENMGLSLVESENLLKQMEIIRKNVAVQSDVIKLALGGEKDEATKLLVEQALPLQKEVFRLIQMQLEHYEIQLEVERDSASETSHRLVTAGWVTGGMALLSGVWVAFLLVMRISRDQQKLIDREREQRQIVDGMLAGVIVVNENGEIENFNQAAEHMFGYQSEEVIGRSISMLFPEEDRAPHNIEMKHYFDARDASRFTSEREINVLREDGSVFPIRIMLSKLPSVDGMQRVLASCFDISEQKEQELRLRSSQKMDALGKLTGGIAHDYNNMLAVILGYTELLKMRTEDDSPLRRLINEIHQAAERGRSLTGKLLAFTRRKPIEESLVDLNEMLNDDRMMLEKTLTAAVTLRMELGELNCHLSLDRDDLANAILNIAINARHAMPSGGKLWITTLKRSLDSVEALRRRVSEGDYVELAIRDTGIGMDEETVNHIFEPFFSTKGDEGTGLGMSQVYGFVQRSGGDITVSSKPGEGTRFELLFPCTYKNVVDEESASEDEEQGGLHADGEHVLVVDDEPAVCSMTAEMLRGLGYQVSTAGNADQALSLLEKETISVVVSDVIMPGMNGYKLAMTIREQYPEIKVQLMSGYSETTDADEVDPELKEQMLKKPFSLNELEERLKSLLIRSHG